ncbi:NADH dehydrogenase [ubiquinone] 1 beta subcomplex subunit 10 [Prorops nasuta]|uniref:NADH dehydrogenase [ubiquinone] 1 beta subcomplex subunit 10 n=1 Tax=Prorops nasuta TaxID=863751 RepID=UPI0034CDF4A9
MPENILDHFFNGLYNVLDGPVTFVREKIVKPNQKNHPWFHRQYRRVPLINDCTYDEYLCRYEANKQMLRDHAVDSNIVKILRNRYELCIIHKGVESSDRDECIVLKSIYDQAVNNFYIKYGELAILTAERVLAKQQNRLAWERRHGKVGSPNDPKKIVTEDVMREYNRINFERF